MICVIFMVLHVFSSGTRPCLVKYNDRVAGYAVMKLLDLQEGFLLWNSHTDQASGYQRGAWALGKQAIVTDRRDGTDPGDFFLLVKVMVGGLSVKITHLLIWPSDVNLASVIGCCKGCIQGRLHTIRSRIRNHLWDEDLLRDHKKSLGKKQSSDSSKE